MHGQASAEETGDNLFQLAIDAGGHLLLADEPPAMGGGGTGPAPYDLLSAALAACTTMTLRMYAQRKGLDVGRICAEVVYSRDAAQSPPDLFSRRIVLPEGVAPDVRQRLLEIADRCPVHQTLTGGARIETVLADS